MAIKFTQVVDFTNQRLVSIGSPTLATDAANKGYVDAVAQGLNWKQAARAASTGNVSLSSPGATLDGVTLNPGDRVLLKNQTLPAENGIYDFTSAVAALVRSGDADSGSKLTPGSALSAVEGTVNGDATFVLVTDAPIVTDTTPLLFSLMNGGSGPTYTAGNGISLGGGAVTVTPAASGGIVVAAGGVSVDNTVVVKKFAANVGDGVTSNITVNHALNTRDVVVELYTNSAPYDTVIGEVQRTDLNNVLLVFGSAPAAAEYRVVVHA